MAQENVAGDLEAKRWRTRGLIALVMAGGLVVMIGVTARVISRPDVPPTCRVAYAGAQSPQDTARVDATTPPGKAMQRCGFYRQVRELRQN